MADTIIAMPRAGMSGGEVVPIKAVDLLDGTYALAASTGTSSGVNVAMPAVGNAGASISMATVDLGGGVYALKTTA